MPLKFGICHRNRLKLIFTILLCNIFFTLTASSEFTSSDKEEDIRIFLENLMIRESGLYTLLGSKPMTLFNMTDSVDISEEGLLKSYLELKKFMEKTESDSEPHKAKISLPDYETYKNKCFIGYKAFPFFHKKRLWEVWQAAYPHLSTPLYKLFSRRLSKEKPDAMVGLFINVPQTVHVLRKYRSEFYQFTGMEFDTDKILDTIEDENSIFWDRVLTNHFLLGLLLGYGEKNAYLFDWITKNTLSPQSMSIARFPELSRIEQDVKKTMKKSITIEDLPIPYFVTFEISDETVERYKKEREKIIPFFKDKDFVPCVLRCLKINDLHA